MEMLRIVLLGKSGAGISSAGNTLLGSRPFYTATSSQGVTQACSMSTSTVDGHKICVVDTPGWNGLSQTEDKTMLEIAKCIDLSDPGPHVFLLVLPIRQVNKEEIDTVKQILEVFGEEASKYAMVLFTRGDNLEEETMEEYLEGVHPDLKKILEVCGGRYHVFNNRDKRNHEQVSDLLEKIQLMVGRNEGKHYTKAMYQKTAEQMGEERKRQQGDVEESQEDGELQFDQDTKEEEKYTVYTAKFPSKKSHPEKFHGEKVPRRRESHSKELQTMELKWLKREAELQKSIERKEMAWLKEKSGLEREIRQLGTKLGEKKTELGKVKRELQQQQVRADAFEKLRQEGQRQREEMERLRRENDDSRETMKQRSTALQRHCEELGRMIVMNRETDSETLQKFLAQLRQTLFSSKNEPQRPQFKA